MEADSLLAGLRRMIPAALDLSQRLAMGLFAMGMVAGFFGNRFRAPPILLIPVFVLGVLALGWAWRRITPKAFNRLLALCFLACLAGVTLQLMDGALGAVGATVVPVGVAAAAVMAVVGFQYQQTEATIWRKAGINAVLLASGLTIASIWHERAFENIDSLALIGAFVVATVATLGTIVGVRNERRTP